MTLSSESFAGHWKRSMRLWRARSLPSDWILAGAGGGYFLTRETVDRWANEVIQDMMAEETDISPCWQNMRNDMSSKMWAMFDETGLFLSLCRHGFVLQAADMVATGEL